MYKTEILTGAFMLALTVLAYLISRRFARVRFLKAIPTVIIASAMIIALIELSNFTYEDYALGGDIATWLLGPATVALAYPLYQFSYLLRENASEIALATISSSTVSIASMLILGAMFGLNSDIILSLLPKCVTTPVAIEISNISGGIAGFTVCGVFISGLFGSAIGHALLKFCGVKSDIAYGLAIGATSHVIGTSKCLEVNDRQAAMSALVLVLVAIFTTLVFSILTLF